MKNKWLLKFLCIVIILVLALIGLVYDNSNAIAQQSTAKIESLLLDQFTSNGAADLIVEFSEQADLTPAYSMDWNTRGEFVYNTLLETATRSQTNARVLVDSSGLKYQSFFASNELYIWGGGLTLANELVSLTEVSFIRAPRIYYIDPIEDKRPMENITWAGDLLAARAFTTVDESTDAITAWGITDIKADQFWTTYGVKGDGIVVANIDTGVQWNHPALDQAFKCASPSNPACWFDPANICGGSACDNNGHGTHTMGTMVGDDDPGLTYIVGMAPNAKWIACKGCETNSCSEASLTACADWILAPNSNPSNRPNIVNNSWGGGGGLTWYLTKVNAWRAAGIFPAFSAGNTGENGCNTLGSPGDYQESFASAAHDLGRNIANFSSRGPSAFGHSPYTKPNISAPGESICSTIPGNGWSCNYSGTSMASPHTAGAVALLWSCNPSLIGKIDLTFQLLQNNADTAPAGNCGVPPDGQGNYTYGYGYLNVLAAGGTSCGEPVETWTQIPLPTGCPDWTRYDGEYYASKSRVYFMGGRGGAGGSTTYGDIYRYNPASNSCADTGVDMPVPISNYSIELVNNGSANLLCTFGGRDSRGNITSSVQCYNPTTNNVSIVSNLPGGLANYIPGGVAAVNNRVYVFGGFRGSSAPYNTGQTWEWNPISNIWTQKGNLSSARGYIDTAVVDQKIYAFGGDVSADGTSLVSQTISEIFNPVGGTWNDAAVADLPVATSEGRAFGFNFDSPWEIKGKIIIAGGGQWPADTAEVFFYDVATNTFDYAFPNLNVSRRNQAGFFVIGDPGSMWVFGGRSSVDAPPYASPEFFNLQNIGYEIKLPIVVK